MKYLNTFTLTICLLMTMVWQANGAVLNHSSSQGFLGVQSEKIPAEKAQILGFENIYGNYVTRVLNNTAAKKAGVQPFDYLYAINDKTLSRETDLPDLLEEYNPGDEIVIHLVRNRKKQMIKVVLGDKNDTQSREYGEAGRPFLGVNRHPDTDDTASGVKVYVVKESTADKMGLQDGDLITAINGYPMIDWTDISTAIDNLETGQTIVVNIERGKQKIELSSAITSRQETQNRASITSSFEQPEWAFFGIYSSEVSTEKAKKLGFNNPYGSYVTGIIGNTAAEKAGIQPFDYIYGIDEYRTGAEQNLTAILRQYKPRDKATIHLIRNGEKKTIDAILGRRSDASMVERSECEDPFLGVSQTSNDAQEGVRVNIVDNSTAASIGIPAGAIITHIDGYRIYDWTDMGTAIDLLKVGEVITVNYLDDGNKKTAKGPIKSYCETKSRTNKIFDWDWDFNFDKKKADTDVRRDVSSMGAELIPIPANEGLEMKNKFGLNLAAKNNLTVNALSINSQSGSGLLRLQFELPKSGETDVHIYNATGRQIYEYDLGSFSGEFRDDIDLAQNGSGNYYLLIQQDGKTFSNKIKIDKK